MNIRERALKEELWCAVKHLLCAEEHLVESTQKMVRETNEISNVGNIIELLMIADSVRALRQRLVDITLGVENARRSRPRESAEDSEGEEKGNNKQ